jgi:hypothetical protein
MPQLRFQNGSMFVLKVTLKQSKLKLLHFLRKLKDIKCVNILPQHSKPDFSLISKVNYNKNTVTAQASLKNLPGLHEHKFLLNTYMWRVPTYTSTPIQSDMETVVSGGDKYTEQRFMNNTDSTDVYKNNWHNSHPQTLIFASSSSSSA